MRSYTISLNNTTYNITVEPLSCEIRGIWKQSKSGKWIALAVENVSEDLLSDLSDAVHYEWAK